MILDKFFLKNEGEGWGLFCQLLFRTQKKLEVYSVLELSLPFPVQFFSHLLNALLSQTPF